MKKSVKIGSVIVICLCCFIMVGQLFAIDSLGNGFNSGNTEDGTQQLTTPVNKIAGVVITGLQVASIAGVIFCGVSYMFASADQRADIKKKLVPLCIGLVIVFAGSTFVGFITGMFSEITGM